MRPGRYRGVVLEIETWPQLRDPVVIIALTGWVDAGEAGAITAATVAAQLDGARTFGHYDLTDLLDLQQTRPTVSLDEGQTRRITWPQIVLTAGRSDRDAIVCIGPEPSLQWPRFSRELVDCFSKLGAKEAFALGGMPALASHRRPISVLATATSLAQEVGAMRTDYRGPTGVQTVLQVALGSAGIPTVGLWAQVPHYIAGNPSPPAVRALLERVRDLAGLRVDLSGLDEQTDEYAEKVEEGLAERPDVAELVREIESESTQEVSGDALAAEIERYLREQ